ncbi:MAG: amidohydrolase family protein [Myxococcales bacterium]|nr:amidohydrolase family protein [Myxococcales bacterium]HIK85980.1 amidohydrolase family protein [Myxococcales bacterium]
MNEFLILGAKVWETTEDVLAPLSTPVRVRDGRILGTGDEALQDASEVPHLDLEGRVLVPGLIDSHMHLELDPALHTPAEQLAVPEEKRLGAMEDRAREMLFAGILTARDCGGGRHREHRLRGQIDRGDRLGPRLLCCGQPITTPGGHCDFWGGAVQTPLEIDRMVGLQVEAGSDWIKVMATGGVFTPKSSARESQFELSRLNRIVDVAARAGRSVAAHCHGTQGIADAMRAGVRTIEHASFAGKDGFGTLIDESLIKEMARAELWVSPTVNAGWGRRFVNDRGEPSEFFRRMSACLQLQRDHGVRFIASTDAGIPGVRHSDLALGLMAFERYAGLRPVDVLRSATSEAARALGIEEETGRIEKGLSADFLVLESDPLKDLAVLRDPEIVVFRGRILDRALRGRVDEPDAQAR